MAALVVMVFGLFVFIPFFLASVLCYIRRAADKNLRHCNQTARRKCTSQTVKKKTSEKQFSLTTASVGTGCHAPDR